MPYFPLALMRNIRAARKAARLTQEQLAEVLDVTVYERLDGVVPGAPPVSKLQPNVSHSDEIERLASACSPEGQRLIRDVAWLIARDYDV